MDKWQSDQSTSTEVLLVVVVENNEDIIVCKELRFPPENWDKTVSAEIIIRYQLFGKIKD